MNGLLELFQFKFFLNAVMAALLSGISCGIAGTYIVSRRKVFITGGITHASFGGIGLAYFLSLHPLLGAAVFAVFSAFGIQFFSQKAEVREDSSIAIWWSLGMALGIIFIYLTPGYVPNLMSYLFGSILTVTGSEILLMAALNILLAGFFIFFFRPILYVSFDEDFARTSGIPVNLMNYLMMALVALTIVLNIRVVGIILVLSLLTIPQATANLFTKSFKILIFVSTGIAFLGAFTGLLVSYFADIPSGAAIIFTLVIIFGLAKLSKLIAE
ncbi:MAG: metal ABC transporter permease [Prolixibacteraceae bacterium]|jgi:zinc transport system permease protein|nr:metal ABC transporter permease [Prolixibacteraceae bacterium]